MCFLEKWGICGNGDFDRFGENCQKRCFSDILSYCGKRGKYSISRNICTGEKGENGCFWVKTDLQGWKFDGSRSFTGRIPGIRRLK